MAKTKKKIYDITLFGVKKTTAWIMEYLAGSGVKIDLLVTLDPKAAKKYHISGYQNLKPLAKKLGIKTLFLRDYSILTPADKDFFYNHKFGIGISYGWQRLIPEDVLNRFSAGIFGFHGSPDYLPRGKGRSPLNWSVVSGRKKIHNHLFKYVSAPDAGPIFDIADFEITPFDSVFNLQYKSILTAQQQLKKLLSGYRKKQIKLKKQSGRSTFFSKRSPADGQIDFRQSTQKIYNLIRGVTQPFPGAFCFNKKDKVLIWEAFSFDKILDFSDYRPGEVIEAIQGQPIVKTKDGSLILKDYESSRPLKKGDILS